MLQMKGGDKVLSYEETRTGIWRYVLGFLIYTFFIVYTLIPVVKTMEAYSRYTGKGTIPNTKEYIELYKEPFKSYGELMNVKFFKKIIIAYGLTSFGIAVFLYVLKAASIDNKGITYLKEDGTHGTANWMDFKTLRKVLLLDTEEGILFGTAAGHTINLPLSGKPFNQNVSVYGAPGTGKSRTFVRNNTIQLALAGQSMVFTDPKGELAQDMAPFLESLGYEVRFYNLVNMIYSHRWNPLSEVNDGITAQIFAETVIANTKASGGKTGGDPFWDRAEQNLLKALVLYVVLEYPEKERNLSSVYALVACEDNKKLNAIFAALKSSHPAKMPYNIYMQASENVRAGVIIGLGTRLQVFQNELVQALTAVSDIDLVKPAKVKCAYFCITSDTEKTFDFLGGLFFSFLFMKLTKYADYKGGKGEKQVYFMLDEFPNIGQIPDFCKKIATMRSRGINCFVIFQNISQMKNRYPEGQWSEIIGCCDSQLFLGATDLETAKFVSEYLGETTVQTTGTSKKAGFDGIFDTTKISRNATKRSLMNPDELLKLPNDKAILLLRGQNPLLIDKMDYSKHKAYKKYKLSKLSKPLNSYNMSWADKYILKVSKEFAAEGEVILAKEIECYEKEKAEQINMYDTSKEALKKEFNINNIHIENSRIESDEGGRKIETKSESKKAEDKGEKDMAEKIKNERLKAAEDSSGNEKEDFW